MLRVASDPFKLSVILINAVMQGVMAPILAALYVDLGKVCKFYYTEKT